MRVPDGASGTGYWLIPVYGDTDINTEVARILVSEHDPAPRFEVHLMPQIQFDYGGPCAALAVDYCLENFHRRVSEVVHGCEEWLR